MRNVSKETFILLCLLFSINREIVKKIISYIKNVALQSILKNYFQKIINLR